MQRPSGQRELSIPAEKYYNQSNDETAPGQAMFLNGKGKSGYSWRPDYKHPGQYRYESKQDYFAQRRVNFKIGLKTIDPIRKSFPPSNTGYYVVRDKDTLESIAQAAGLPRN